MAFVKLKKVKKSYAKVEVLRGLSLDIEQGESLVIQGVSGSGKSTLLYLIGGLDQPCSGELWVAGQPIDRLDDKKLANYRNSFVGFVFQFHFLLPSMTCWQNILLPAKIGQLETEAVKLHCKEVSKLLGVEHCLSKYPFELSGGEQQRINIIRALSLRPKLLLCDEPTGNLDSENSSRVTLLLKQLASEFAATLMIVTHDDSVAEQFNRKVVLRDGQL